MNELKRVVSALAVTCLIMVLVVTPLVAALPAAADDGAGPRGLLASLGLWLENLLADLVADVFPSESEPPAGGGNGAATPAGDGDEFMGLIIPGG